MILEGNSLRMESVRSVISSVWLARAGSGWIQRIFSFSRDSRRGSGEKERRLPERERVDGPAGSGGRGRDGRHCYMWKATTGAFLMKNERMERDEIGDVVFNN